MYYRAIGVGSIFEKYALLHVVQNAIVSKIAIIFCREVHKLNHTNNAIIGHANPHTIKKFELIEKYVEAWAHKLLQNQYCEGLVFIDCMSNSGEYIDDNGNHVFGTPVRVAKYLRDVAGQYPNKQIDIYYSDFCADKTNHLKGLMPKESSNFHYYISTEDGNNLAKRLGQTMSKNKHYLLIYDPFDATIDWSALIPFINNWGEVILNHMVSDPMRAVKMVKSEDARSKYERTYLMELEALIPYGSDKKAYEDRIEEIINKLRRRSDSRYYIAAFPFFNEKNAIVYNLIYCTSNIQGFKLYKQSAWQIFGGKSSMKNTHGLENQLTMDFDCNGLSKTHTDEFCFYIKDIAEYLQKMFDGMSNVPLENIWAVLDDHPVFPSDGFKRQIKDSLKQNYGAIVNKRTISFLGRNQLNENS